MSINSVNQNLLQTTKENPEILNLSEATIFHLKVRIDGLYTSYIDATEAQQLENAVRKMIGLHEELNRVIGGIHSQLDQLPKLSPCRAMQGYVKEISADAEEKLRKMLSHKASLNASILNPSQLVANYQNPFFAKPTNPFIHSAEEYAVGFCNAGNNSWINSLLSLIVSIPSYRRAYETVAKYYIDQDPHGISKEYELGLALTDALTAYDEGIENKQPVEASVSQNVRVAFHHLFFPGCELDALHQEDAHEALMLLMGEYGRILNEKRQSDPNLECALVTKRFYEPVGEKRQPNPFMRYATLEDHCCSSDLSTTCQILLDTRQEDSFDALISEFFINPFVDNLGISDFLLQDGQVQSFKLIQERHQFKEVPYEFLLTLKRLVPSTHMSGHQKLEKPIAVPLTLVLPAHATEQKKKLSYELDAFIVHKNVGLAAGHYICYKKIDNQWVEVNDNQVTLLGAHEIALIAPHGDLFHYSNPQEVENQFSSSFNPFFKVSNPATSFSFPNIPFTLPQSNPPFSTSGMNPFFASSTFSFPDTPFVLSQTPPNPFFQNTTHGF